MRINGPVLITGSVSGIGKATAEVLAAEGCNLILVARGAAELDAAAASIRSSKQVNVRTIAADALSRPLPQALQGHSAGIFWLAFSPQGDQLATASYDRSVRVWPVAGGPPRVLVGHTGEVTRLAFSPDGKRLASVSYDKTARLWDLATGEAQVLKGHADWLGAVAFSPDGRHLATGGGDASVRLWSTDGAGPAPQPLTLEGMKGWVTSVAFSPDGRLLVASSGRGELLLYSLATGQRRVVAAHPSAILGAAFSPDGRLLATGGLDQIVRLWPVGSQGELGAPQALAGHEGPVRVLEFSPDGALLVEAVPGGAPERVMAGDVEQVRPVG